MTRSKRKYKTIAEAMVWLSKDEFDEWMDEGMDQAKAERENEELRRVNDAQI